MKIWMNEKTKIQKQIHGLEGVIDAYKRTRNRDAVVALSARLVALEKQLEVIGTQPDDGVRFLGVGWVALAGDCRQRRYRG